MPKSFIKAIQPGPGSLSGKLSTVFNDTNRRKWMKRRHRTHAEGTLSKTHIDIVSEGLCDDIIKYLAPSLEKHKGCTLVDFHPGACVWSSKLHEFLKPKRHVLIEPDERYFEPFIKPLLQERDSTYRHTFLTGKHSYDLFSFWKSFETEQALSLRPETDAGEKIDKRSLNPHLLVTGNIARRFGKRPKALFDPGAASQDFLGHMSFRALCSDSMHTQGLVRMLWWIPDDIKRFALSTKVSTRISAIVTNEVSCSLREVAGVKDYTEHTSIENTPGHKGVRERWKGFDTLCDRETLEKMKATNTAAPKDRQLLIPKSLPPDAPVPTTPFEPLIDDIGELRSRIDAIATRLRNFVDKILASHKKRVASSDEVYEAFTSTLAYPYTLPAMIAIPKRPEGTKPNVRVAILADIHVQLVNLEANFKRIEERSPDRSELDELRKSLIALIDECYEITRMEAFSTNYDITDFIDELISFYGEGSVVAHDSRPFEPLRAETKDFWPPETPLALLDMTPRGRDLAVPDLASQVDASRFCWLLIRELFRTRRRSVVETLDKLAPSAGKDLVPMVPSLTDVRKGGRLDPNRLKTSMLSHEMIEEITKAFFEWPFKPQHWESSLSGGASDDPASADEGEGEENNEDEDEDEDEY